MKLKINYYLIPFGFLLFLVLPFVVYAQTAKSNCWVTKIGNTGTQQPTLPPECQTPTTGGIGGPGGNCGTVADWATKIAGSLVEGGGGSLSGDGYDNRTQDFKSNCGEALPRSAWAGQYWCTYLVIDAYNLAGIEGLSVENGDANVEIMHNHWRSLPGFFALDYNGGPNEDVIRKVKPGFAIFYGADDHVGTVKSISFDERGNGTIETNESNSSAPSHKWPISEWKIINGFTINGFGGH